jgi:hypothetical protein
MDPQPPIVIDECGSLEVYPSVSMACYGLEAIDVKVGAYEAFDSAGRRLSFRTHGEIIALEVAPDLAPDPHELERRLRRFIEPDWFLGAEVGSVDAMSLPEMLRALLRFQRGDDVASRRRWFRKRTR